MKKLRNFFNKAVYGADPEMMNSPAKRSLDAFIYQVIFGNVSLILIGGTFICGFLLRFHAPDTIVNYVTIIPLVCGIFLVFLGPVIQSVKNPRKTVFVLNIFAKFFMIFVVFVPLVLPGKFVIPVVTVMLVLGYGIFSVLTQIFNNWYVKSIPETIKGRYFSVRQVPLMLLNSSLPVVAGIFVDSFKDKYHAFLILFCFAIVDTVIESYVLLKIPDCTLAVMETKPKIIDIFRIPLRDKRFMRLIYYMMPFYFVLYVSLAIRQIYMMKYLGLSYTYINGLLVFTSILQAFVFYRFWGKANDRIGARFVLTVSVWFYAIDALFWFFIGGKTAAYMILPICYILAAAEGPSFSLGFFHYMYEIIPEKGRSIYSSFYASCLALTLLIAPLVGSLLMKIIDNTAAEHLLVHSGFRLLSLFTFAAIIAIQIYFMVREKKLHPESPNLDKNAYRMLINMLIHKS